ncbi:MAG: DUF2726 domain-containing protein [Methylococcales bacterium]|nr:DUF2726 domain-containing protein [Methylococcales bacterium]
MNTTLAIFVAVVIILIIAVKVLNVKKKETKWPFYAKKPLSTPEQVLFFRLTEALPENIVLAQVQLSRLMGVKKGYNFHEWNNRINRMSADFVICEKDSKIKAVIELDDSTHEQKNRKIADQKKDSALNAAGIKIIRWNVKEIPNKEEIKRVFHG